MKPVIIILAAGTSSRFQTDKMFASLGGLPLFLHSVKRFLDETDMMVLVVPPGAQGKFMDACKQNDIQHERIHFVEGGSTRTDSVTNALAFIRAQLSANDMSERLVAIHDAARPFATVAMLRCLCATARAVGGAAPGTPIVDTVLLTDDQRIVRRAVPRANLWRVSTPQVFRLHELLEAYAKVSPPCASCVSMTDDSQVFIANGGCVKIVTEEADNMKITFPDDLGRAEWLLKTCGFVPNQ